MPAKPIFSVIYPAGVVSLLFAITLTYTGAGFNLHRLALCGVLLLLWLATSITTLDPSRLRFASGWLPVVVIAYLGWLFLAPFLSAYPYASSTTGMSLAVLPLAFFGWLLLPGKDKEARWHLTWQLLLLCAVALAIWGILDFLVLHQRARAIFLDPNAYAALINLILLPVAYAYLSAPSSIRYRESPRILLSVVAVLALAQSMSLSRGALLTLIAVLPFLLWLTRRRPAFRSRLPWLLSVLILASVLVKMAPLTRGQEVDTFMFTADQYARDASIQERLMLWKSTWKMIEDSNPVYGSGLGTFKTSYSAYREASETSLGNFAHNDYLQAMHEGGVIQLAFFLALAVFAPVWLLRRSRLGRDPKFSSSDITPGLLLGVMCVSLHALVNFIHYVGPISLLTGVYLARGWEAIQPRRKVQLPPFVPTHIKSGFVKVALIFLLAIPTFVLVLDGIIFKLFATDNSIHTRLEPGTRFTALNLAIALRPGNPMPRILLIRGALTAAENTESVQERETLLQHAERETALLSKHAPILAVGPYFAGKTRALRGTLEELVLASEDLERAVELVPSATGMRLELVKVYQRLGLEKEAYQTVLQARKWIRLEVDMSALTAFAKEAQAVALSQKDGEEARYWSNVHARLAVLRRSG